MGLQSNELEQQEQQLRTEELALEAELASTRTRVEALSARVNAVQQLAGTASPPVQWTPPELPRVTDGEAALERARKARLAAIEARRTAAAELKRVLQGSKKSFEALLDTVARDEAAVKKQLEQRLARAREEQAAEAVAKTQLTLKAVQPEAPRPPPPPVEGATQRARPSREEEGASRRVNKRVLLETVLSFSSDSNVFMGFSTNVSEGGVFVATHDLLPVGTEVDVQFTLPDGKAVAAKGKVRWLREGDERNPDVMPGIGVQFGSLADDASAALHTFIEERDPMFYAE